MSIWISLHCKYINFRLYFYTLQFITFNFLKMNSNVAEQRSEFDPRKALVAAKNAARGIVKVRFEAFGCAGLGSRIKPISMEAMSVRYG